MIKISIHDEVFDLEENVIFQSLLIKNIINDLDVSDQAIPLNDIKIDIFKKIIEYAEYHKDDKPVIDEDSDKKEICDWDKKFMDLDKEVIIEIILAANYLDIKSLLNLGCRTMGNMIIGKSIKEIREILEMPFDSDSDSDSDDSNKSEVANEEITKLTNAVEIKE